MSPICEMQALETAISLGQTIQFVNGIRFMIMDSAYWSIRLFSSLVGQVMDADFTWKLLKMMPTLSKLIAFSCKLQGNPANINKINASKKSNVIFCHHYIYYIVNEYVIYIIMIFQY